MIPRIAIIDQNTLEATGLKSIIGDIAPMADVSIFSSVEDMQREMEENTDGTIPFVHFFVSSQIVVERADFFLQRQRQTIVLTAQPVSGPQFSHFRTLCTAQLEHDFLKSILTLFQHAHGQHSPHPTPAMAEGDSAHEPVKGILSARETEVLALIVRGFINKEIADRHNISINTVITHRKNITRKTGIKTVAGLTVYAILNGYVDINSVK